MNDNGNKPKKSSSLPGVIVLILVMVIRVLMEEGMDGGPTAVLFGFCIFLGVIVAAVIRARGGASSADARRTAPTVSPGAGATTRPAVSPGATAPARTAEQSFTAPEPFCVVCEHSGEDHFERDRQRRLKQVDGWLASGLIDRREWRTLRNKYASDGKE